jgi:hypothetical protein
MPPKTVHRRERELTMGFWHTGYAEFHESAGLEGFSYTPSAPVLYACAHCSQSFSELEDLRRHRFERHPVRQPILLLRGQAVGALPLKLLMPLSDVDVVVEDASTCTVNGRAVEPSAIGKHLALMTREFVDVELVNEGAKTLCRLDFRIAEVAHLAGVEAAFLSMARAGVLSINAISRFIQDCSEFGTAMPYCDGICKYLYGVMAKEQAADSGLQVNQYVEQYMRASDELSGINRPLARCIRAVVAFHFNQFEEAESLAPDSALRHASGAFAGLLHGLPWHFETAFSPAIGDAVESLLTDQDTLEILAYASCGLLEFKERADELAAAARRAPAGYDRLKRMLLAGEALAARDEEGCRTAARRLARELVANPATNGWAEAMLEKLRTV